MIASMTAFARHSSECPQGLLVWEIRSVNHRYLEPAFRLPEALRELETELREALRNRLARGKLDCQLRLQSGLESSSELVINQSLARQLVDAAQAVARVAGKRDRKSVVEGKRGALGGRGSRRKRRRDH